MGSAADPEGGFRGYPGGPGRVLGGVPQGGPRGAENPDFPGQGGAQIPALIPAQKRGGGGPGGPHFPGFYTLGDVAPLGTCRT